MAELLLELFSEEIPARMQPRACDDLERLVAKALADAALECATIKAYATPRRLALHITGLPKAQADVREERRGPRADAPAQAIEGFLKSTGLTRDQLEQRADKKGTFLYAVIERAGRATAEVLADILPGLIRDFPWPKSMRWGAGALRWVRPLQSILCLFDGVVVPFDVDGIKAGPQTQGHRFMAPGAFTVKDFADYQAKLKTAHVILDPFERQQQIIKEANALALVNKVEIVRDDALVAENAGLTEWPVVLMGGFDQAFLDVPAEVLTATMRGNQKYFSLRDPKTKTLTNAFLCVANIEADDGGRAIIKGNEKVLSARLADAKFFWDQDLLTRLEDRLPKLADIVFHEKLGSMADKVERVAALVHALAPACQADPDLAAQAARLAKADLVSAMVGEFPEVQGIMGGYYAAHEGLDAQVAAAIRDHYKPQGPDDACPTAPVTIAVSLADKIDTLAGFFAIDEKPTGSKDPYALRRAALGVIRLIVENGLRLPIADFGDDLLAFFIDRLKVQQREKDVPHDLIDAVFSLGGEDDLVRLLARVSALRDFLATEDGANLLAGYKRAVNILRIEEKKDGTAYQGAVDAALLREPAEKILYEKIAGAKAEMEAALAVEDFAAAMAALAALRGPVDAFFDQVTVNADDTALRANRLNLLNSIRNVTREVADFSKIEG